ncbi:alkaline phosphatase [Aureibacter tunicatorum]|uniref:Alkaline phosphatase n=1 Tax=Aureibacter tunicatorum TaxID=866807 RepID=A0AAE4BR46_9BACT|nr:alkaline phosphatase [Aureibacter tunicatorum]MDR6237568.1 alkaline phosphatase [Aureibacter tunicatorum]BDD02602.1 alkaline phosphatase [Aureibacter tunicatorum]
MNLKKSLLSLAIAIFVLQQANGQQKFNYPGEKKEAKTYEGAARDSFTNSNFHEVKDLDFSKVKKKAKNIILLIADGAGASQFFTAIAANHNQAYIEQMKYVGFSKTSSSDDFTTDSAAGGTALSTGEKTYNGAIGLDKSKQPIKTILEIADEQGLATGLVATSKITHATPAAFIAHQPSRNNYQEIAAEFLNTDINVFIGGGLEDFHNREDERNLVKELENKGYQIANSLEELEKVNSGKVASLLADGHMPAYNERGEMLKPATEKAIEILSQDKDGFFLMIEGSQIDWGGHGNNTQMIVEETLDFDHTLGAVLEFAAKDGETLVIVTADHETGGYSVNSGDMKTGKIDGRYTTKHHTGVMVPVFAVGPQAELFSGIYENTAIFDKMMKAFEF